MTNVQQRYRSPLRYPGGKAKLIPFVQALFRENGLEDGHYAEPYAGGASIALALLFEEYATRVFINDIDVAVYSFWSAVLDDTEEFCRLIRDTPVTADEWHRQRGVYREGLSVSNLELGFATFFLNRTNRSGIIASGGMIGGNNQSGDWKIDARYNAVELIRRVEKIARYRTRIEVSNLDAIDFLAEMATALPERSLTYLDPPYYVKGQRRLYTNGYAHDDHARIADLLVSYPRKWLVSYDAAPEIMALYAMHRQRIIHVPYTASERQSGEEVIVISGDLTDTAWGV